MTVRPRLLASTVAALGLLAGAAAVAPTATPAEAVEACDGVRVVVDAGGVDGPTSVRCAPDDPASGLEALRAAGHEYAFVPRVPGMVCTIDARPDPCNGAPADAYWSYWHAEAGGSWNYSNQGAGQRDPAPGTVEGWAFGGGDPPSVPPPAPPPTDPDGDDSSDDDAGGSTDGGSPAASGGGGARSGDSGGAGSDSESGSGSGSGSGSDPGTGAATGNGTDDPDAGAEASGGSEDTEHAGPDDDARGTDDATGGEPEHAEADTADDDPGPDPAAAGASGSPASETGVSDDTDQRALAASESAGDTASMTGPIVTAVLVTAILAAGAMRRRREG